MANAIERWFDNKKLSPFQDFSLAPFQELSDEFDQMGSLISDFMKMGRTRSAAGDFNFAPSCEIKEAENAYIMKVDLPGVHKDQVRVEVDNNILTINAERREEKEYSGGKRYLSEIYYGTYTRSFTLPGPVEEKKVDAKFQDGVLTVSIPKTETIKTKEIPIH